MRWILADVAVALAAVFGLVVVAWRLWRTVRATTRALGEANERLATAQAALDAVPRPVPRARPAASP